MKRTVTCRKDDASGRFYRIELDADTAAALAALIGGTRIGDQGGLDDVFDAFATSGLIEEPAYEAYKRVINPSIHGVRVYEKPRARLPDDDALYDVHPSKAINDAVRVRYGSGDLSSKKTVTGAIMMPYLAVMVANDWFYYHAGTGYTSEEDDVIVEGGER